MELKDAIVDIIKFMRQKGLKIDPLPRIFTDDTQNLQDDPFIKTGYYQQKDSSINLFTNNRHIKDILRTFCHEMIHHNQHLEGKSEGISMDGDIADNKDLREIERDAYERGNLMFRDWTEWKKKQENQTSI